ncbi:MAG: transporter permease [Frankiales bacterium]|nr:transporter permease [Frankiales bacterium]
MSSADTVLLDRPGVSLSARLLRSELRLVFGRRRNQVLLVVLALVPVLVGVAIRVSSAEVEPGEGPPFIDRVSGNGLFLAFTALAAVVPFLLPLAVGVVAGDAVAGEAQAGTLRYLLTVPVSRTRVLVVKYGALVVFGAAASFLVAAVGLGLGAALFPTGDVTLLSGTTVSETSAIGRALLVAAYVSVSLAGLSAIGLAVSAFTEVPVAAMATTVVLAITSQILDAVPQLDWLHPYLFSHHWLAFGDLVRDPVPTGTLVDGLQLQAAWIAVALAVAWSRFTTKDVTS